MRVLSPRLFPAVTMPQGFCCAFIARCGRAPWLLLAAGSAAVAPVLAQVEVGRSTMRKLVPAETGTSSGAAVPADAGRPAPSALRATPSTRSCGGCASPDDGSSRSPPRTSARCQWRWEVNLLGSQQINAFCARIAFYTASS